MIGDGWGRADKADKAYHDSHMHIHLTTDCDLIPSNTLPHVATQNIPQPGHLQHLQTSPDRQGQHTDSMLKMGRKPRGGILHSLPCLILKVRAMSEAQPIFQVHDNIYDGTGPTLWLW